jgi:hypothetical protein
MIVNPPQRSLSQLLLWRNPDVQVDRGSAFLPNSHDRPGGARRHARAQSPIGPALLIGALGCARRAALVMKVRLLECDEQLRDQARNRARQTS